MKMNFIKHIDKNFFPTQLLMVSSIVILKLHIIIVVYAQVPYFLLYDIFCFSKLKVFSNRLLFV